MELTLPLPDAASIIGFVLVLCRVGAVMALAPVFSGKAIPLRIRAMIAVGVTVVSFPVVEMPSSLATMPAPALMGIMAKEMLVGLAIGFAAGVVLTAWAVGGAILDLMTGFSYGGIIDPLYGNQSSILQQLYTLLAGMIFVTIDGDHILLGAISTSFDRLPLDAAPAATDFSSLALSCVSTVFVTGLGVIAPVFAALLLTDLAFGLVSRAAPQTQVFQLEFPVKIAVAITIMIISLPLMVPLLSRTLQSSLLLVLGG